MFLIAQAFDAYCLVTGDKAPANFELHFSLCALSLNTAGKGEREWSGVRSRTGVTA